MANSLLVKLDKIGRDANGTYVAYVKLYDPITPDIFIADGCIPYTADEAVFTAAVVAKFQAVAEAKKDVDVLTASVTKTLEKINLLKP